MTDAEWALVEPLMPPAKRGGRKRTVDVRDFEREVPFLNLAWPRA